MTETENRVVRTYTVPGGFVVEITRAQNGMLEAWLFHEDFGVKNLMFGGNTSVDELAHLVELNVDSYICAWLDEYCEED